MKSEDDQETHLKHLMQQPKGEQFMKKGTFLEEKIFSQFLNCPYEIRQIQIEENQFLYTIYVPSLEGNSQTNIYISHGFGGTSFMYFPIIPYLRKYGNLVLWEIRGMGVSEKLKEYHVQYKNIKTFFTKAIQRILDHYSHENIIMINHSFSCYLVLLYLLDNKNQKRIKKFILLSPVGITPRDYDYKSKMNSFRDFLYYVRGKICWKFNLTFKSPLRKICCCFKKKILLNAFSKYPLTQAQIQLMTQIFIQMIDMRDGSENLFFQYFQPRVLPKQPVQHLFTNQISQKIEIYFGQNDWADKNGAKNLANIYENITFETLPGCQHLLPFYPQKLKEIVDKTFNEND